MTKTEALAQWYLRLNGFLTISNFVLHLSKPGSAETDVDVIGVRFPHRKEFNSSDIDESAFRRSAPYLVLAEVKTSKITLNRAWAKKQIIEDILKAVGICPASEILAIAESLRVKGEYDANGLYSAILFIGDEINAELQSRYPASRQLCWEHVLKFIHDRFRRFKVVKTQVDQWDDIGQALRELALAHESCDKFVREARRKFYLP